MKTILTENWILDEAKHLFSKFNFVEKLKLFQFSLEGHTSALTLVFSGCREGVQAAKGMRSHPSSQGWSQEPWDSCGGHNLHAVPCPSVAKPRG